MHQADAYKLLADELAIYLGMKFDDLEALVGESIDRRVRADDATSFDVVVNIRRLKESREELLVDGMVAVAGTGPLRRLDRSYVVSRSGVRSV